MMQGGARGPIPAAGEESGGKRATDSGRTSTNTGPSSMEETTGQTPFKSWAI